MYWSSKVRSNRVKAGRDKSGGHRVQQRSEKYDTELSTVIYQSELDVTPLSFPVLGIEEMKNLLPMGVRAS